MSGPHLPRDLTLRPDPQVQDCGGWGRPDTWPVWFPTDLRGRRVAPGPGWAFCGNGEGPCLGLRPPHIWLLRPGCMDPEGGGLLVSSWDLRASGWAWGRTSHSCAHSRSHGPCRRLPAAGLPQAGGQSGTPPSTALTPPPPREGHLPKEKPRPTPPWTLEYSGEGQGPRPELVQGTDRRLAHSHPPAPQPEGPGFRLQTPVPASDQGAEPSSREHVATVLCVPGKVAAPQD